MKKTRRPKALGLTSLRSGNRETGTPCRGNRLNAFSHPDFTVGSGVSPDRALAIWRPLAGCTAGQDLTVITRRPHQSPKAMLSLSYRYGRNPVNRRDYEDDAVTSWPMQFGNGR